MCMCVSVSVYVQKMAIKMFACGRDPVNGKLQLLCFLSLALFFSISLNPQIDPNLQRWITFNADIDCTPLDFSIYHQSIFLSLPL